MSHVKKALAIATAINTSIFLVEIFGGIESHSSSLTIDGIHNFSDELAIICLWLAYLLPVKMSKNLQRGANALNSIGIIFISILVVWQAIERIISPTETIAFVPVIAGLFAAFAN